MNIEYNHRVHREHRGKEYSVRLRDLCGKKEWMACGQEKPFIIYQTEKI